MPPTEANTLPAWALWVQTLGIPFFGVILAGIGAYIALQQKRIADVRLQHDLFDRRYKVYDAVRKFISVTALANQMDLKDLQTYMIDTSDAVFLFDQETVKYLNQIRDKALEIRRVQRRATRTNLSDEENEKLVLEQIELSDWFQDQFEPLIEKFKPFMRLDIHHLKRKTERRAAN